MVGEDAKEKEEMSRKPVHIFSTLRDAQPGNYTCLAGESSTSIAVESKPITCHPLTPVVVVLVVCTSFLLLYLWRRYHTMKADDRGLTMSMAGLEYCSMAPGDITVGVMGTDGNCMGVKQTYQPPADSEYGPGTGLYPQTFANWSQVEKAPGAPQTEASNGSLPVQPNKIVPPRAPKWSPATNRYKSIMPGLMEALELLAQPPARVEYSERRDPGVHNGDTPKHHRESRSCDEKVVKSSEDSAAEAIPNEMEKSGRGWTKIGGRRMSVKEKPRPCSTGSNRNSTGGEEGDEWETASETM